MSLQYLPDGRGQIVAVQVPIEEWEMLKRKYPDIDASTFELPDWQKELIDVRLRAIDEHPERILPIDGLFAELDRDQE
jgi:hypothetical protein